jgi:catechol 2,3-dioxygenase-like lactoylglutathione lyase family enzyme
MTVNLKRVDLAVLFVSDVDRAKAFYRDTFGLQAAQEDEDGAYFHLDGGSLMLLSTAGAQDLLSKESVGAEHPDRVRSQLVAFVDDVDAAHADLVANGVEFVREPMDREWGVRTAHFKDLDGHIWELAQQLSRS